MGSPEAGLVSAFQASRVDPNVVPSNVQYCMTRTVSSVFCWNQKTLATPLFRTRWTRCVADEL